MGCSRGPFAAAIGRQGERPADSVDAMTMQTLGDEVTTLRQRLVELWRFL